MNKRRVLEKKPKNLNGFPVEETNGIFCGVLKSRFKRKVIINVKEYEQGNWIHARAASLFCLQPRPVLD